MESSTSSSADQGRLISTGRGVREIRGVDQKIELCNKIQIYKSLWKTTPITYEWNDHEKIWRLVAAKMRLSVPTCKFIFRSTRKLLQTRIRNAVNKRSCTTWEDIKGSVAEMSRGGKPPRIWTELLWFAEEIANNYLDSRPSVVDDNNNPNPGGSRAAQLGSIKRKRKSLVGRPKKAKQANVPTPPIPVSPGLEGLNLGPVSAPPEPEVNDQLPLNLADVKQEIFSDHNEQEQSQAERPSCTDSFSRMGLPTPPTSTVKKSKKVLVKERTVKAIIGGLMEEMYIQNLGRVHSSLAMSLVKQFSNLVEECKLKMSTQD